MEEELLAQGTIPAVVDWPERVKIWYYAHVKDRLDGLEGGNAWEPIKILLERYKNSNKTNTASKSRL
jgi:hypothetical protein